MTEILLIETSARRESVSGRLAKKFAAALQNNLPNVAIRRRNLTETALENLNEANTNAIRSGIGDMTADQQAHMDISDKLIAELQSADIILIAAPMHNFTVSASLRTWLDYVVRPGRTFGYGPQGPQGKLADKPVYVFSSRGGDYGDASPQAPNPYDFQSGYIRHILGFIGLKSVQIIPINGMDMGEEARAKGLAAAERRIDAALCDFGGYRAAA